MERGKLKRHGGIFVEVIVSILLFTVGILALTGTLFYGVKMVAQSREETVKEQEYKNLVEKEILSIIRKPSYDPSGTQMPDPDDEMKMIINNQPVPFTLYKYKQKDRTDTEIYLIKGGN